MSRELQHAHTMDQFKEVCHGTNCNASQAAEFLQVHADTLYRLLDKEEIPAANFVTVYF